MNQSNTSGLPLARAPRRDFASLWQSYGTFGILVLLLVLCSIASPQYFLTRENLVQVLLQSAVMVLLACGVFFTILIAGIDLSVGSVLALSGMVMAKLMMAGMPLWLAVLIGGVGVGALLGAVNGALVNLTQLHPFIITLGTAAIYRGVTLIISDSRSVFGFDRAFVDVVAGRVFGVPVPIIIAAAVAGFLFFITRYTKLGRNLYALGGNAQAAFYSGISVKLHTLVVFVISGTCAGLAGVVTTARTGGSRAQRGNRLRNLRHRLGNHRRHQLLRRPRADRGRGDRRSDYRRHQQHPEHHECRVLLPADRDGCTDHCGGDSRQVFHAPRALADLFLSSAWPVLSIVRGRTAVGDARGLQRSLRSFHE